MDLVPIRNEVIEARRSRKDGAIVLARPVPMKVAAGCGAAVTLALGLLLVFGEYASKVRVTGQLVYAGGAVKVVAPQFGRITARYVKEGQAVTAGQALFDLSAERMGGGGSIDLRIGASLENRREQIIQRRDVALQQLVQREAHLADQQRLAQSALATHRGAVVIQDELVRSAHDNVERYSNLAREGYVAPAVLAQYKNALEVELAKRNALMLNLSDARRALLQVQQEAAALAGQGRITRTEAAQALAALEQEAAEHDGRSALRVSAPAAGVVTAFGYSLGQTVQAGAVLAAVLPAGHALEAQLLVPAHARSSVEAGQTVQLRIDSFPYQKYGMVPGTITQVELNPINDGVQPGAPGIAATPMYRATVALSTNSLTMYGKRHAFETGLTLEADIFNDRRRLIEWVFDPLVSAAKDRAR